MAQIIVNGERVGAKSGEEMPVVNPATEEVFDTVPKGGPEDADAAVAAAKEAFKEWSEKEIAQLLVQERGKPMMESMGNCTTSCTG